MSKPIVISDAAQVKEIKSEEWITTVLMFPETKKYVINKDGEDELTDIKAVEIQLKQFVNSSRKLNTRNENELKEALLFLKTAMVFQYNARLQNISGHNQYNWLITKNGKVPHTMFNKGQRERVNRLLPAAYELYTQHIEHINNLKSSTKEVNTMTTANTTATATLAKLHENATKPADLNTTTPNGAPVTNEQLDELVKDPTEGNTTQTVHCNDGSKVTFDKENCKAAVTADDGSTVVVDLPEGKKEEGKSKWYSCITNFLSRVWEVTKEAGQWVWKKAKNTATIVTAGTIAVGTVVGATAWCTTKAFGTTVKEAAMGSWNGVKYLFTGERDSK